MAQAKGAPLVIVFVHELTRPSIGLTRVVMKYAASRKKDGLVGGVYFLSSDRTALETQLKRARHALPQKIPIGIASGGREGPGSYGLNRKMTLTVLIGKDNRVTANFPLVQPSLQADAPKILAQIVKVLGGGKVPTLAELGVGRRGQARGKMETDPQLRPLIRPVIQKTATKKEVEKAAAAVEAYVEKNEKARQDLGRISRTIIDSGKLKNYGTPPAQDFLRKWAKKYGPKRPDRTREREKQDKEYKKKSSDQSDS